MVCGTIERDLSAPISRISAKDLKYGLSRPFVHCHCSVFCSLPLCINYNFNYTISIRVVVVLTVSIKQFTGIELEKK